MKKSILPLVLLIAAVFTFSACDNDDDDRFTVCPPPTVMGKWQFVEMLDGKGADFKTHRGAKQPQAHYMEIKSDGRIVYTLSDGKTQECTFYFPENQDDYITTLPVIIIADPRVNMPGIPFGIEEDGTTLKLHFFGTYTTDHIPETYVYKRISYNLHQ